VKAKKPFNAEGCRRKRSKRRTDFQAILFGIRELSQKRPKRRTDVQAIFSTPLIVSTELKRIRPRVRVAEFEEARFDNYKLVCYKGNFTQAIELAQRADTKAPPNGRGLILAPHGFAYFRCHRPVF
jgi:hypothetical protein